MKKYLIGNTLHYLKNETRKTEEQSEHFQASSLAPWIELKNNKGIVIKKPTQGSIYDTLRDFSNLDSAGDVAELVGVSQTTALKLMKAIGGIQFGSRWKISETKLDEFIDSGEHIDLRDI